MDINTNSKIIVIDDHNLTREALKAFLVDYDAIFCKHGKEGLHIFLKYLKKNELYRLPICFVSQTF
ncbi:MAG: hypothetical protein HRT90_11630 [Candidatus Margulisbacteria bacterium]|nr:hypothetical protein [Candidatus Margulisiibacteriota bacterium]